MVKRLLLLLTAALLWLGGCESRTVSKENTTEEPSGEVKNIEIENKAEKASQLKFIDAHGEWHETTIDPEVKKHDYDFRSLSRNGTDITYSDQRYTLRKGIDVSEFQGKIDWKAVYDAGYDFAFIRVACRGYGQEGKLFYDAFYRENIVNAQAAGLDVGVYIFSQAINEKEALEEADYVLSGLEGLTLQLPVVYDPELIKNDTARTDHVTGEQFTKNTIAFCEKMKEHGLTPMIYSNMVWEGEIFQMSSLNDYTFWYADYEKIPQTPYHFSFWQHSEKGSVPGIEGAVDLNIWFVPS